MKSMDTNELKKMKQKGEDFLLVNVLGKDSFNQAHIPGSENVPVDDDDFTEKIRNLSGGKKDRPVVVYCASTSCDASPKAARRLEDAGFSSVRDYEGGVKAWKESGLELAGTGAQG